MVPKIVSIKKKIARIKLTRPRLVARLLKIIYYSYHNYDSTDTNSNSNTS